MRSRLIAGRFATGSMFLTVTLIILVGLAGAARAGSDVRPFFDLSGGTARMRTGWGPSLGLRPGVNFGGGWSAYLEGVYAAHVTGVFDSDAAGFLGGGVGRRLGSMSGAPVTGRVGLATFDAAYEALPDPGGDLAVQVGVDVQLGSHILIGVEWTFLPDAPKDGLLFLPLTIRLGGGS